MTAGRSFCVVSGWVVEEKILVASRNVEERREGHTRKRRACRFFEREMDECGHLFGARAIQSHSPIQQLSRRTGGGDRPTQTDVTLFSCWTFRWDR
jgi:hypothetical protein